MLNLINIFKDGKEQSTNPFLCDQVKVFGVCKGPCLERHALCKTLDKDCLNIPKKCFISIQLTKIVSASHFYGRILKYSTAKDPTNGQSWVIINDSFEQIKQELINVGSLSDTKVVHKNLSIGEMVMIETDHGNFFRAIILNVLSGWFSVNVKVKLIDLGHIIEISSCKVFELPSHLKEFRPVAVEIIISSMEPIEKIDSAFNCWPVTTTQLVRSLLEPIMLTDLEFICKVELTLGITLWVDWLLAKKCIKCSHFACKLYENNSFILPKELIQRNVARANSQLIDKLMNLNKDAQVWKDEFLSVDNAKNESLVKKSNKLLFACEDQKVKINEEIQAQWAYFSDGIVYDVSVDYVEHPKCILVRNLKFFDRISALQTDINEAVNNKTVTHVTRATVETVCLAIAPEGNNYNRVLITKVEDQTADVFYVDYGGYYTVKIETLLTIPSNLITKLPFQVIECNLSGFEDIVEIDDINKFNNRFLQLTNTKIHLKVLSSSKNAKLTGGSNYEVVLFNNDININITMSDEFSMYVNSAQIQNILNSNYNFKYEEKDEFDEDEFDEDDFQSQFELLQNLIDNSNKANGEKNEFNLNPVVLDNSNKLNEKKIASTSENINNELIKDNCIETFDKQILSNSANSSQQLIPNLNKKIEPKKGVKMMNKFCLDCNVTPVVPQCFWHQDETWIYLKLNILSVIDYKISHTVDSVTINVVTNTVSYFFKSIFYAFVLDESFTCHVGYDGIYIKIQKLVQVKYQWPRLVKCPKKHKYIIYDVERIIEKTNSKTLWIKIMNSFKMKAHGQMLNTSLYDSQSDDSDDSASYEYSIYDD